MTPQVLRSPREAARRVRLGLLTRGEVRSVRRRLVWTAFSLVVIAALVAAIGNTFLVNHTPEQAVENYLAELRDGRYLSGIGKGAYGEPAMSYLSDAAYAGASGRVEAFTLVGIDGAGQKDRRNVTALVKTSEGTTAQTLPVRRIDRPGPFYDSWEVEGPRYGTIEVSSNVMVPVMGVNGVVANLRHGETGLSESGYGVLERSPEPGFPHGALQASLGRVPAAPGVEPEGPREVAVHWRFPALPGDYRYDATGLPYYSLRTEPPVTGVGMRDDAAHRVDLPLRPSPRMWSEVDERIQEWLATCEASTSPDPAGCPGSTALERGEVEREDMENVQWRLLGRPALSLMQDSEGDPTGRTWVASRHAPARMELTYDVGGQARSETLSFPIDARVVSDGRTAHITAGLPSVQDSQAPLMDRSGDES
ncbi:hypothetical protein [Rothia halotolerans]|uniref:hypothetical protein n=1 Tax=Rothia halotolerans TaxID=405770 RepID=UPI00101C2CC2|nr:hypothetical protein [Rothia halotolerans]